MRSIGKLLFASAYLLQIISVVYLVRSQQDVVDMILLLRMFVYFLLILSWSSFGGIQRRQGLLIAIAAILFSPYLLTNAWMSYIDILIMSMFVVVLGKNWFELRPYFIKLAFLSMCLVACVAVFSYIGVLPSNVFEWDGRVKNSMGFLNPNTLYYFLFSSALVFYVFRSRLGLYLSGALIVGFYPIVGSRTFLFSCLVMLFLWFRPVWFKGGVVRAVLWIALVFILSLGFSMVWFPIELSSMLSSIFEVDANEILSNRLDIAKATEPNSGVMTFLFGGLENTADSLYVFLLNGFGVFGVIIFAAIFAMALVQGIRRSGEVLMVVALIYLMVGLVELPFDGSSLLSLIFFLMLFGSGGAGLQAQRFEREEKF